MNEGMIVRHLAKSKEPPWCAGWGRQHRSSSTEKVGVGFFLQSLTDASVSFPFLSHRSQGKNVAWSFFLLPTLVWIFQIYRLLPGPELLPNEKLGTGSDSSLGEGHCRIHPPRQLQPSSWHSFLCLPICLSPFLTSPPRPSSPSSLLLLARLFSAFLPASQPCWMTGSLPSPSHTAGLRGQASAREGREAALSPPSHPTPGDQLPGLDLWFYHRKSHRRDEWSGKWLVPGPAEPGLNRDCSNRVTETTSSPSCSGTCLFCVSSTLTKPLGGRNRVGSYLSLRVGAQPHICSTGPQPQCPSTELRQYFFLQPIARDKTFWSLGPGNDFSQDKFNNTPQASCV